MGIGTDEKNLPAIFAKKPDAVLFDLVVVGHSGIHGPADSAEIKNEGSSIHMTVASSRTSSADGDSEGVATFSGSKNGERIFSLGRPGFRWGNGAGFFRISNHPEQGKREETGMRHPRFGARVEFPDFVGNESGISGFPRKPIELG